MTKPRILAFAGSVRKDSFNRKLIRVAAEAARKAGCDVTLVELADYPLPIMDEDLETREGAPANAQKLKELFLQHQGLLIAAPEYNSSITPLLKNTLDWVSRPIPGKPRLACYLGKTAGLLSASAGALGGMRGLVHLRSILGNIEVLVIPQQFALSRANEAFDASGELKDAGQRASAEGVATALAHTLKKLHSAS